MKSHEFCFWLQGFFEVADPKTIDEKQLCMIKKHLALVFVHEIDPTHGGEEEQKKLNAIHNAPGGPTPIGPGHDAVYRC